MPNPSNPDEPGSGATQPASPKTPLQNETVDQLNAAADALRGVSDTDLSIYRAANDRLGAIDDRISTLLNLNLVADTDAMVKAMPGIQQARGELESVLKNISKAGEVINGVAKFLSAVDVLIQAAKVAVTVA
jgi:hypothetical protein